MASNAIEYLPGTTNDYLSGAMNSIHQLRSAASQSVYDSKWLALLNEVEKTTDALAPVPDTAKDVNECRWSKTESDRLMDDLDPKLEDRLDNMFGFVILDEAHVIKQISNKTSITIEWLRGEIWV